MIKENYLNCLKKIKEISDKNHQDASKVTLIAVSKTKPVSDLMEAYDAGARDFGENKVQEILDKYDLMPKDVRWHMIGHLQTNKVKYIIDKVCAIHSVDSYRLAQAISKEAVKCKLIMSIFIEVNVAAEETKFGVSPIELYSLYEEIIKLPNIKVLGLMTVAPYVDEPEKNRQHFVSLRNLSVDINNKNIDNDYGNLLSMGMSGDFETAIEEGADYVRVGTGIFGKRNYSI